MAYRLSSARSPWIASPKLLNFTRVTDSMSGAMLNKIEQKKSLNVGRSVAVPCSPRSSWPLPKAATHPGRKMDSFVAEPGQNPAGTTSTVARTPTPAGLTVRTVWLDDGRWRRSNAGRRPLLRGRNVGRRGGMPARCGRRAIVCGHAAVRHLRAPLGRRGRRKSSLGRSPVPAGHCRPARQRSRGGSCSVFVLSGHDPETPITSYYVNYVKRIPPMPGQA